MRHLHHFASIHTPPHSRQGPSFVQPWVTTETQSADFGDERLNRRYSLLLHRFSARPCASIPAACVGRTETEGAYRFFDHPNATPDNVLEPHRDAAISRIQKEKVVLLPQDTTEIDLTRAHERVGGPLNEGRRWGLYAHPVVAFTPQRVPLGVVDAFFWSRDEDEFAKGAAQKRAERRRKPIADKESQRWLDGYQAACQVAQRAPDTQVISIADSEADIYELFVAAQAITGKKANWIVRACQDRALTQGPGRLAQEVGRTQVLGELTIQVRKRAAPPSEERPRRKARSAREAKVTVRATQVSLRPPQRAGATLPVVVVNAILVREENPPPGEEAIEWLLLTDLPIASFAEALQVVKYYGCRWEMEIFFRILKSGCRVEKLQLEEQERMEACLAMYLIVAWRIQHVTMLGRECPEMSCTAVFAEEEWQAVMEITTNEPAPPEPPSLGALIKRIAELGGYLGRKHDGPPGPKAMWIGMQRMRDFAMAWKTFGPGRKRYVGR